MKTTEEILREHEETNRADYLNIDRRGLQRLMDGHYKEGLIDEGNAYRNAIIELDKKLEVDEPIDRLPAAIVVLDLEKRQIVKVIE